MLKHLNISENSYEKENLSCCFNFQPEAEIAEYCGKN